MQTTTATGERLRSNPGLADTVRLGLGSAVSYLQARLQLAGLEAKEAIGHYLKLVIFGVIALVALVFGYVFLLISLVFIIAHAAGWNWEWVLLAMAGVHFVVVIICGLLAWQFIGKSVFSDSLAELKKDQAWLTAQTNKQ